jgi:2'-5' RNA ligase
MSEVIETPVPSALRNHWWWRPGWKAGRHYYACHLTLDDQLPLRSMVRTYQRAIEHLPGLDLIPAQWLHLTMQGIGFTDEITASELHDLADALTRELSVIDRPKADFHDLTVHPEAVYLKAHPVSALYPLRIATHRAVACVLGPDRFTEPLPTPEKFNPHVSIAYVNTDGEAEPVVQALMTAAAEPVTATFAKASLLVFHRDARMYEWTSATPIAIGTQATT